MEQAWRALSDDLGPEKVVLIRAPGAGLEAVVVIDNVACGPAIGGIRMAPDVTVSEVARLARAMSLKNAAAGRRTPPDWWHDQRRMEHQARATTRPSAATLTCELPNVPDESRQAFEKIADEMFSVFLKMGQPESAAKANAEKFAQECAQRGEASLAEPLQRLFKG